ncbi:MAG: hypothetical protein HC927_10415 [Deltaproteobacteria bacterium]|nr:hypothetical protein [Deltaproteobacteria bacterium]
MVNCAKTLAQVKEVDIETIGRQTSVNAQRLFARLPSDSLVA